MDTGVSVTAVSAVVAISRTTCMLRFLVENHVFHWASTIPVLELPEVTNLKAIGASVLRRS
jgi:uncharacterized protein YrrD